MTEPLFVDTQGLHSAGQTLQSLELPTPPAPVVVAGTDPVATAISATAPVVEEPVVVGLGAVAANLSDTAGKFVTAATTYAESDRRLGEKLAQHTFTSGESSHGTSAGRLSATTTVASAELPAVADDTVLGAAPMITQLGQVATFTGTVGSTALGVTQSVQGAVGNVPAAAAAPQEEDDDDRDGAAAGEESGPRAPVADDARAPIVGAAAETAS